MGELEVDECDKETDDPTPKLSRIHKVLVKNATRAWNRATNYYNKALKEVGYELGDRVLLWNRELSTKNGNKVVRP